MKLAKYETKEQLKTGLLTAIHFCGEIDDDFNASYGGEEIQSEEDDEGEYGEGYWIKLNCCFNNYFISL